MAKRRAKGEGTIYYWDDKKLWVAQLTLPGGKKKTKYGKTQKEVKEWLLDLRKSIQTGVFVSDDRVTVSEFFWRFLNDTLRYKIKPKTYDSYSSLIRLHIEPTIGHIRLTELQPYHLQDLYSRKIESGLSKRTVQYIHALIHRCLEQALKWGLVVKNVSDLVEAPRPEKKPPKVFTLEQVRTFLNYIKNDRLYGLYAVCIGCGLRLGEVLALQWEDVNFDTQTISINRTLQYLPGRGLVIGEPKSEKSRRLVSMPEFVSDALYPLREESGIVFQTSNGTPFSPRNTERHFKNALEKAGLPIINFHGLRHTYATLMLQQNVHPKIVQEALGHSTISLTIDTYSSVIPSMQKEAANKLDELRLI